jgi:tripartite-type tricarboxylate transporter receptor subunit TctC
MRLFSLAALLIVAASPQVGAARAQTWPDRSIRIIAPGGPGGGFDTAARLIADKIGQDLGQTVIVENRPGAGSLNATMVVARAAPDGYTLLLGGLSNIALNVGLYRNLPYNPLTDFTPINLAVSWSFTLVGRKELPVNTLPELIAYAKAHPRELTYASTGTGSGQHVAMAVLSGLAGVEMQHVAYRSAAEAYQDILGGRVDLIFDNTTSAKSLVESGGVKTFAVSSAHREAFDPDVPTVMETGVAPFDMDTWFGLFAPAGTPTAVVERLRQSMEKAEQDPALVKAVENTSGQVLHYTAVETDTLVQHDIARWKKLISDAGVSLE